MLVETGNHSETVQGSIASATATVPTMVSDENLVTAFVWGTYAGVNITFEISPDGTNWFAANGVRPDTNAALTAGATGVITSNASVAYHIPCQGALYVRARATAWTSGTASVWFRTVGIAAPNIVTAIASGTTTTSVSGTVTVDSELPAAAALAEGAANPTAPQVGADGMLFNGTTWDRERGNATVTVEASSAKTTTATGTAQVNYNARGVVLFVNVTASSGTTPTLVVKVQHSFDGTTFADVAGAATASITGTGLNVLTVYPGVTVAANAAVSTVIPRNWRIAWTIGGTTPSFTFTAYAQYVL